MSQDSAPQDQEPIAPISPEVESDTVRENRRILTEAQAKGKLATLGAYVRLSGPGWLQSAITLGGGSLAGALFLGALGGTSMLWLQLVAIIMGVVMLSAISYVTLSSGERPLQAINTHINPALGWGWLIATSLANMIWCMPQFALAYGALSKNLTAGAIPDTESSKYTVSIVILVAVSIMVFLNAKRGKAAKVFDWFLKALVAMVVICFFGVVIYLGIKGALDAGSIFAGFVPDLSQWNYPSGRVAELIGGLSEKQQDFWEGRVVSQQRARMIGAAATAVGINMTFLMPYSMLHRGWDKPFRGLARFDLGTGMAIPYVLVTSCVVIAASNAFHGKAEADFLVSNVEQFVKSESFKNHKDKLLNAAKNRNHELFHTIEEKTSGKSGYNLVIQNMGSAQKKRLHELMMLAVFTGNRTFAGAKNTLLERVDEEKYKGEKFDKATKNMSPAEEQQLLLQMVALPDDEKKIAASMVQRKADELAQTLAPLIGEKTANYIFGIGVFGMGFSTIIILMLINGFVFCEAAGKPDHPLPYALGCLVAGVTGAMWPIVWQGESQFWLAIVASSFGMILLPIAYFTFFMMMNSRAILGEEKPKGGSMFIWNVLMGISVLGAVAAAGTALYDKITDPKPLVGWVVLGILVVYLLIVAAGFFMMKRSRTAAT